MDSLSPYMLRCFNPSSEKENKYFPLDKVGSFDTYHLMKDFIREKKDGHHVIEDSKQVYRFERMHFNDSKRIIYGWFQHGTFGRKSDILNIDSGKVDFEKTQKNAEILNHFIYFSIPNDVDEAVMLLHVCRGIGIKTVFYNLFREFFLEKTKRVIQMNSLSYEKAMSEWANATAKEIRLVKFNGFNDKADAISCLGHNEETLILKPKRRKNFGLFKDLLNKDSESYKAVESLQSSCETVKTVLDLNGRKRVFSVGSNATNAICEIDAPEDLKHIDGNPEYNAMKTWCSEIEKEFSDALYS